MCSKKQWEVRRPQQIRFLCSKKQWEVSRPQQIRFSLKIQAKGKISRTLSETFMVVSDVFKEMDLVLHYSQHIWLDLEYADDVSFIHR